MGSNPMTYLGEEAVALPRLTSLLLDHMSLQDLSDTALTRAPRLTHLDLSHNQLRCPEPPRGPTALLSLNLTGKTPPPGGQTDTKGTSVGWCGSGA